MQSLYHVRRKGSGAQRHLLSKPWLAGIISAQRSSPGSGLDCTYVQSLYHTKKQAATGCLQICSAIYFVFFRFRLIRITVTPPASEIITSAAANVMSVVSPVFAG